VAKKIVVVNRLTLGMREMWSIDAQEAVELGEYEYLPGQEGEYGGGAARAVDVADQQMVPSTASPGLGVVARTHESQGRDGGDVAGAVPGL
jgi:hypothetical protein